jgi:hypothetical protein
LLTIIPRINLGLIPKHVSHNRLETEFHSRLQGRKVGIAHAISARAFRDNGLGALAQTAIGRALNALEENLDENEKDFAFAKYSLRWSTNNTLLL